MTEELKTIGDLEINEDFKFEKRQWVIERIGWVAMLSLVIAALLGAFGRGPLSQKTIEADDKTLSAEYDYFGRVNAQTNLKFKMNHSEFAEHGIKLWLDHEYIDNFEVKEITPEPERIDLGAERMTLVYRVSTNDGPLRVNIILEPAKFGSVKGSAGVVGKNPITFTQFIYP